MLIGSPQIFHQKTLIVSDAKDKDGFFRFTRLGASHFASRLSFLFRLLVSLSMS